jgi:cell division protein FtsW (lipid II flippase)
MAEAFETNRQKKEEAGWERSKGRGSVARGVVFGRGSKAGQKPIGGSPGANADHVVTESDKANLEKLRERPPG